jgi:hypothetical protein
VENVDQPLDFSNSMRLFYFTASKTCAKWQRSYTIGVFRVDLMPPDATEATANR